MNRKIGLFGGTFDPIHNGHLGICESFLNSKKINELWVIPASIPPQKEISVVATFQQRLEMLHLAFKSYPKVKILDIEDSLPKPNYTIQTVEYLKKTYPNNEFKMCLGSDSLANITTWFKYQNLVENISFLVAKRPGVNTDPELSIETLKVDFVSHKLSSISSSNIRAAIKSSGYSKDVPKSVLEYIQFHQLYIG